MRKAGTSVHANLRVDDALLRDLYRQDTSTDPVLFVICSEEWARPGNLVGASWRDQVEALGLVWQGNLSVGSNKLSLQRVRWHLLGGWCRDDEVESLRRRVDGVLVRNPYLEPGNTEFHRRYRAHRHRVFKRWLADVRRVQDLPHVLTVSPCYNEYMDELVEVLSRRFRLEIMPGEPTVVRMQRKRKI